MLTRMLSGPVKGLAVGALLAAALVEGLELSALTGARSYLAASACGFLTGIVAGKPVWAAAAKTEAVLKAIAGGAMAAGILFALRRFVGVSVSWGPLGTGKLVELPFAALPGLGALLGLLFEIDDAVGRSHESPTRPK
jgi:hypothetical protein